MQSRERPMLLVFGLKHLFLHVFAERAQTAMLPARCGRPVASQLHSCWSPQL